MPCLRGASVTLAILAVFVTVEVVEAAPLDKAKAAIDASDYFGARSALEEVLRAGDNQPAELAELYRLTGQVHAALGDAKAATAAFQRCLALAPQTVLPPGTSPKIAKPFKAAQDLLAGKQPLQIKTETTGDPPSVTIDVVEDPLSMIVKVRAIVVVDGKPEQQLDQPVAKQVKIDLPRGKRLDLRVVALDEHGNHLSETGTKDVPIVIVGKAEPIAVVVTPKKKPPPPPPFEQRPIYLRWWLWAGASIAVLGAGSYFAIDAVRAKNLLEDLGAESANHPFDTVEPVESRARRDVLLANIGLIGGGVLALTTGVLYLTRPKQPAERRLVVAPTASSRIVGIEIGGSF